MGNEQRNQLYRMLSEEYGIRTAEELEKAIQRLQPLNIAVFTVEKGARV